MREFSSRSGLLGVVSTNNGELDFRLSNEFLRSEFAESSKDGGIVDDMGFEFPSFVVDSFCSGTFLNEVGNSCFRYKQFYIV
jgi:hypothetical protein